MWTQLPPEKRAHAPHPIFGPCLLWPNGRKDEDAAWYGTRPRPRPHCTRRGPSCRERGTAPPLFDPCLLWPRSPISATAQLLLKKLLRHLGVCFLANVNAISCRPSVCRLSVVCNVRAPLLRRSNIRQYFYCIRYLGHPVTSIENFTEIVPGEPLRHGVK